MFIFLIVYQIDLVFPIISKNLFVQLVFIEYLCAGHYTGCSIYIARQIDSFSPQGAFFPVPQSAYK